MKSSTNRTSDYSNSDCSRCGVCCEKGGPGFHQSDRKLIEKGTIPTRCLFTIRKGEFAYDNVKGALVPVESDVIKIKGQDDSWTCLFFDDRHKSCTIYHDRPLECRVLKCWDTLEFEQMYAKHRLTREDLISAVDGLWDLVRSHQERCDYDHIRSLIENLAGNRKNEVRRELAEIIQYDIEIRQLVVAKGNMDPEMLEFLFGRPLTKTLPKYGIRIRQQGEKILIVKTGHQR